MLAAIGQAERVARAHPDAEGSTERLRGHAMRGVIRRQEKRSARAHPRFDRADFGAREG